MTPSPMDWLAAENPDLTGSDPRPLPFPAIRWALARAAYAAFIVAFGAVLWVAL